MSDHFESSNEDADSISLSATGVGTTAAPLLLNGTGSALVTPDNYVLRLVALNLVNKTTSAITATVQIVQGSGTPITVWEVPLAASSSAEFDREHFRLVCPPGYTFQVLSSAAASLDVQARARLTKGAG